MNYKKEDYYTEMTIQEYFDFNITKRISFNKRDIKRLLQLSTRFKLLKDNNNYIRFNDCLNIDECENEWFVVYFYPEFYKCDQIDELIYFLKDKGILID